MLQSPCHAERRSREAQNTRSALTYAASLLKKDILQLNDVRVPTRAASIMQGMRWQRQTQNFMFFGREAACRDVVALVEGIRVENRSAHRLILVPVSIFSQSPLGKTGIPQLQSGQLRRDLAVGQVRRENQSLSESVESSQPFVLSDTRCCAGQYHPPSPRLCFTHPY